MSLIDTYFYQRKKLNPYYTVKRIEKAKPKLKMEFHFNFNKPTTSRNVGAFLNEKLKTDRSKELLQRVTVGKKLQYGEANCLLKIILNVIIISDGSEEEEISVTACDDDDQMSSQDLIQPQIVVDQTADPKMAPKTGAGPSAKGKEATEPELKRVCHFYSQNNCKFEKDCRYEHSKICFRFFFSMWPLLDLGL